MYDKWREVLCNILTEFYIATDEIKSCLNEIWTGVRMGKLQALPIQNGLKQGKALLFKFA
jgi:hypothetical protein